MNRQLSSFDFYLIVQELKNLVGSHIDKIYQLSQNEILIKFRNVNTKNKEAIYVRNGEFLCLTEKQIQTPERPSTFAMTLRKYLQNGRIANFEQHEFDRIIKLYIAKKQGVFTIVFEFFGDGNIILVDPDNKIIIPLTRQSWAHRKVKGRQDYSPPPSQLNPFTIGIKEFNQVLKKSSADIVRTLAVNFNLSGVIAEELCVKTNIKKEKKIKDLTDEEINKIYNVLKNFLTVFKNNEFKPVIVKKDKKTVDILPFKFESYKEFDFIEIDSFSRGLENFIDVKEQNLDKEKVETKIDKKIGKLERMLSQQKQKVLDLKKDIRKKQLEGELIYLNYQKINKILDEIKKVLECKEKKEGITKINELDIVKKFSPNDNLLILKLFDASKNVFDVKINFRQSVTKNAEKAYDDSKKLKGKLKGAEKSIKKTLENLDQIKKEKEVEKNDLEKKESRIINKKKTKTFWFERYRWFISSENNIIIGGRDAGSNDQVVKKYLKSNDRYAHANISGAPSIVIKNKNINDEKNDISNNTLEEACVFAASFSKAWKQFAEAQAYWVLPEQVSKTPQSGEFVPRGAFIIRGKRNYVSCKLEVAVGKILIDDVEKIMCGPVSAVKKHCENYFVLEPGGIKKSDVSKKIAKAFNSDVEEVSRVLPPGGAVVIESKGVKL